MGLNAEQLIQAIDEAFRQEWNEKKDIPLPSMGQEDRLLLFSAVARGVLKHLKTHESDWLKTIIVNTPHRKEETWNVVRTDLNISQ